MSNEISADVCCGDVEKEAVVVFNGIFILTLEYVPALTEWFEIDGALSHLYSGKNE